MKFKSLLFLLLLLSISCKKEETINHINPAQKVNIENLEIDFSTWWIYHTENIFLSLDFNAFDENNLLISNQNFFKKLETGKYIPYKIGTDGVTNDYKLVVLSKTASPEISSTIQYLAQVQLDYLSKIGKDFHKLNFTDIYERDFVISSKKNKITLVKCWFINCQACVEEFSELNQLVEENSENKNISFLSLAFDSKEKLINFNLKHPFHYVIVPNQKDFIYEDLLVNEFPTHFVLNGGKIEKIFNDSKSLILYLKRKKYI